MKKLLSAFLAFVMIFTTVAPATKALAQSLPTATATEMQMPTPKDGVSHYHINVEEPKADKDGNYIMSALGGAININYPKEGVKKEDVVVKFFKDGEEINPDYNIGISEAGSYVKGAEIKSQIPKNETGNEIIYNIFVKEKTDAEFDSKNSIEIKVKPLGEPVITGFGSGYEFEKKYDDEYRNITAELKGSSLTKENVLYDVSSDFGNPEDLKVACSLLPDSMFISVSIPKNETKKTIEYKISFYTKNNVDSKYVLIIKSLPKNGGSEEPEEPVLNTEISMVKIDKETLNPGEKSVSGKIFGSDLDSKNIVTEVKKSENAKDIEVVLGQLNEKKTYISYVVNAPENKTATNWEYEIKFSAKNKPTDVKTVKLTVVGSNEMETGKEFAVKASTDKLLAEGGEVLFYITGDGFDISNLKAVIKKGDQRTPHKVIFSEDSTGKARFVGKLTLPKNLSENDEIYDISINKVDASAANPFVKKPFKVTVLAKSNTPAEKTATLKVYNNEIEAKGGNAVIYIDTKDYDLNEFKTEVKLNGTTLDNPNREFKKSDKAEHNFMYSLPIAENKVDLPKVYEITILDNNNKIIGTEKFTQKAAEKEVNSTVYLQEESKEVESSVGSVSFNLVTTPTVAKEKVKLQITKDGTVQNLNYTVTGDKAKKTIELDVPENKTGSNEVYTIKFNANGSETTFQDTPVFTLTVKPAPEEKKAVIEDVYVQYPNLPLKAAEGSKLEQSLNIKGTDLNRLKEKSYKIYEKVNGEYVEYSTEKPALQGTDNLQSVRIPIKESKESKEFKIVVKLDDTVKEVFFKQSETGNTNGLQHIIPDEAFTQGDDTVVINFFSKIEEAAPSKLKEAITIMAGSKAIKLSKEDSVEINGSQVIVKFKEPVLKDKNINYALNIAERSYSNGQALNRELKNYTMTKNSCSVDSFKFIEGYQLDSKGGKVQIKITGHNLLNENEESNLKLKIQENSKEKKVFYDTFKTDNIINDLKITGTDNEQIITFTAPVNTGDKVKTYTILVSRDGGKLYTASLPATLQERFTKSVIAVLPKGADPNKKMIDFIQIQSYGTQGGGDGADITHTDLPTGQGSKKTLVWIYGTNLDASKSKVRLKDVNGVYWSPIHDAVYDSSDRVMMTMMDAIKDGKTFGMSGKGNNMLMEVILPNGYKPDGQEGFPEGVTFEYEVAPDGINFNKDTKVTGTVLYDGATKTLDLKDKVIDLTVRHVNEDGKDIVEPRAIKGYKHLPPNTLFYGLPLVDENGEFKDSFMGYKVKDTEELVKGRDAFGHNKFYYDGKTVPELLNSKGELVLVYKGKNATPIEEIPTIKASDIEKEVVKKGEELDLTDNIKNLPEGSTVKDITEPKIDTNLVGNYTGKVEVTFPNGSKRIVEVPVEVIDNRKDNEKYEPEVKDITTELNVSVSAEDAVTNKDKLPEETTYTWKEEPDVSKAGEKTVTVVVTYADKSTDEKEVKITVIDNRKYNEKYEPEVKDITTELNVSVSAEDAVTNKDKLPEETTYTWKEEPDVSKAGEKTVTVVVTYADKSTDEKEVKITVIDNRKYNEKYEPEVKDITTELNVSVSAEDAVTNKDKLPEETTYTWKEEPDVSKAGEKTVTVVVTYADKSTDEVEVSVVVEAPPVKQEEIRVTFDIKDKDQDVAEFERDEHGGIYITFVYKKGKDASEIEAQAPKVKVKDGYEFKGWTPAFKGKLTEDTVYTAVIEKVKETEPTEPTEPSTPTDPTIPTEPSTPTPGVPTTPSEDAKDDKEIKNTDTFKEVFEKIVSTRIAGKNRQQTAVEVSKRLYKHADTIVLTSSSKMIDSLTSSPLGIALNAPTLFVEKDTILQEVLAEINRLQPKKVIIAGGNSVVSEKVVKQIEAMGVKVERTAGENRFQTAVKLGEEIRRNSTNKTDIILANGYNLIDALTAGSLAAKMNIPILLTGDSSLNSITEKAIKEWGIKNVIVVGGDKQVSNGVISKLQNDGLSVERIAGKTRVETSLKLAERVNPNPEKVIFANGRTYADALIASYLSKKENAPIVLIDKENVPVSVKEYLRKNKIKDSIILGGDSSIANVK